MEVVSGLEGWGVYSGVCRRFVRSGGLYGIYIGACWVFVQWSPEDELAL